MNTEKQKKFWSEFKEFAMRGNVMDLAVGVIIGGAFQKIVSSLVADIISPLLGLFGGINFENKILQIGDVQLKYGAFITTIIDFLIMAFIIFLMIKLINKVTAIGKKKEEEIQEPTTKVCPYCLSEIDVKASRCKFCTSEITE